MKKLLIPLILSAGLAAPVQAEIDYDFCEDVSDLAYSIMRAHQVGVPMSRTMNEIGGMALTRTMVEAAYAEPRYSTAKYQERAQAKFRDEAYLHCVKTLREAANGD